MINKLLPFIISICFFTNSIAQLQVNSISESQLGSLENFIISDLLGCSVEIINVEYGGNPDAIGFFDYIENDNMCQGGFDLDKGLIMTTGNVDYAAGPNSSGDDGEAWNVEYQDDFIHNYLVENQVITNSVSLYDACVLEFDIISPELNSIDFEVIFGSEEYTEWMSPFYADVFCFFVSEINGDIDPNFSSIPQNIMETGDVLNANGCNVIENKPISPWTIRPYSEMFNLPAVNECLYVDNPNGDFCNAVGYDGYTIPMHFNLTLQPNAMYRIKMIILDGVSNYWAGFDSGVFIKKLDNNENIDVSFGFSDIEYSDEGATVYFNNLSTSTVGNTYSWDFDGDGYTDSDSSNPSFTFNEPGDHIITLEVINNCTGETVFISSVITIEPFININESQLISTSVFPNPSNGNFTIQSSLSLEAGFIEIFDVAGRLILQEPMNGNNKDIDIASCKKGLYFIEIKDSFNQVIHSQKIFIL